MKRLSLVFFLWAAMADTMAQKVHIGVASNFLSTFRSMVSRTTHENNIVVHSASSGQLHTKILYGAPIDIFFSADELNVDALIASGKALISSKKIYACGAMVAWAPRGHMTSEQLLKQHNGLRVALANPKLAPYGVAATQYMQWFGLDQKKLILITATNVAGAYQLAWAGSVDLAFVALSQVKSQGISEKQFTLLPLHSHRPIKQSSVLIRKKNSRPVVNTIYESLFGAVMEKLIRDSGYRPLKDCKVM